MSNCIFCNFGKIKDRTIATIDGFHITISLGQITNGGYLLIIPTKHIPCLGAMGKIQVQHFEAVLDEVFGNLYLEYNQPVSFFEHGIVGQTIQHAHLHIFPAAINLKKRIISDFPNSEIQAINDFSQLRLLYKKKKQPYLLWSTPQNETLVCWNPPAPPEYFRLLIARLLRVPERGSWRNMDSKLDQALICETMEKLSPVFTP